MFARLRRLVLLRRLALLICFTLSMLPGMTGAQARPTRTDTDSVTKANLENRLAVLTSGTWDIDGEYKGPTGTYYKLTGYLAYVAATSTSRDGGERAVISIYLEPLAGGVADWLGARLACTIVDGPNTRCNATSGATSLLDLNFVFRGVLYRGERIDAEISAPDAKDDAVGRWTGRSTPRGRFTLVPFDRQ